MYIKLPLSLRRGNMKDQNLINRAFLKTNIVLPLYIYIKLPLSLYYYSIRHLHSGET